MSGFAPSRLKIGIGFAAGTRFWRHCRIADVSPPLTWSLREVWRLLPQLAELSLLLLVVNEWAIEGPVFARLLLLATLGFAVHHALPLAYRLPFFCALSIAAIGVAFGREGMWLVGVGLMFVGVLDLPLPYTARVLLVVLCGAGLVAMRAQWIPAPWPASIWPVLGSMFMFRLIVYLYDLRHSPARPSFWQTLAYFFMLPNPCFPLFPVVDFATFRRSHYDDDAYRIYGVGLSWILRGITHLVLYRFVYQNLVLSPDDVHSPRDFAQHAIALFLLYLRVSGQFHVIVGILRLFGFNLPATHRHYFLASSFTDFWRRTNIYWKDFMAKHFFYPVYFRLRGSGPTRALVGATLVVFVGTWLLHSYQWFWLIGSFPITGPDLVFWGALGLLVLVNSLYEAKHGRERRIAERARGPRAIALHATRVAGTFAVICVLWAIWSSESLSEWWALVSGVAASARVDADPGGARAQLFALALLPLLGAVVSPGATPAALEDQGAAHPRPSRGQFGEGVPWGRFVTIAILLALAQPALAERIGGDTERALVGLRSNELNAQDTALLERGYYENLLGAQRLTSRAWEQAAAPDEGLPSVDSGEFQGRILRPNAEARVRDLRFTTNRLGMRDRDYASSPPPGTHRIVMVGASHLLGIGVGDGENFESLLEKRLASEPIGHERRRFEILNLAMAAYSPLQSYRMLDRVGYGLEPDAVVMVIHRADDWRSSRHVGRVLNERREIPYPYIASIAERVGAVPGEPLPVLRRRLEGVEHDLLAWTFRELRTGCEIRGCAPLAVYIPQVGEPDRDDPRRRVMIEPVREAGLPLLDLSDVYGSRPPRELQAPGVEDHPYDTHPNAAGHAILADRLYRELAARPELVGL